MYSLQIILNGAVCILLFLVLQRLSELSDSLKGKLDLLVVSGFSAAPQTATSGGETIAQEAGSRVANSSEEDEPTISRVEDAPAGDAQPASGIASQNIQSAASETASAEPSSRTEQREEPDTSMSEPLAAAGPGTEERSDAREIGPARASAGLADIERRFGTQWVVWAGGIALALGGIFLVRYSIEQGYFGPAARTLLGVLLAAGLFGAGELLRLRETASSEAKRFEVADIPSIITGAATLVAYADVWAAHALYGFLSNGAAFVLLGLVALGTLFLSLRHGPALAGLGLLGAYVTPLLIGSEGPNYWALYVYLSAITASAYALARQRDWLWLAVAAAVISTLWTIPGLTDRWSEPAAARSFYLILGCALGYVAIAPKLLGMMSSSESDRWDFLASGVFGLQVLAAFVFVIASSHDAIALFTLIAVAAIVVPAAMRLDVPAYAAAGCAVAIAAVVARWALIPLIPRSVFYPGVVHSTHALPAVAPFQPEFIAGNGWHIAIACCAAALFGLGGFFAQRIERKPWSAYVWSGMSVGVPLVMLVLVYLRMTEFERSAVFSLLALALSTACGFAASAYWDETNEEGPSQTPAIYASGAVASFALMLTIALEKGWLVVALALTVPGVAWISTVRPAPILRRICAVLVGLVVVKASLDPKIVGDDLGDTPILNWLLWGYGVPAISFWLGAKLLRKHADDSITAAAESAAILFGTLCVFLEIRHYMNDGDIYRAGFKLPELGLQVTMALAEAAGFERVRGRSTGRLREFVARLFGAAGFVGCFLLVTVDNPMLSGEPVHGVFFNELLLGYLFPAALMFLLARSVKGTRPVAYYLAASVMAMLLALAYLTLEVRTIYHGAFLDEGLVTGAEDYTYSAVWLAFGVILLGAGVFLRSSPARFASAAVVVLTVSKVFLHDLANVEGLFRALSFLGLGAVLIGIGLVYQKLLFADHSAEASGAS